MIALVLASCGTRKAAVSHYDSTTIQDDILAHSKKFLGKPYRYAGKGPNAFDCSGFTAFIFKDFGYRLNSSSAGQDRQVPTIANRTDLRKGDLVFFEGRRRDGNVGHVGIVSELLPSGQFKFIHASTTSGVIISSSSEPYYAARYLRGGRVLEENASYVTRQNPSTARQQKSTQLASMNTPVSCPAIPEVLPQEGENRPVETTQSVVLVQSDPLKNPPLTEHATKGNKEDPKIIKEANSEVILRENSAVVPSPPVNHIVKMGETLYSISRHYGCTVDQLKDWNPRLGTLLKTGDTLLVYANK